MKNITMQAAAAFLAGKKFKKSNTEVDCNYGFAALFLFGNCIAHYRIKDGAENGLTISTCGWRTKTTKERLNALPGVSIFQKAGVWYLNGKEWDGGPTLVKPDGAFCPANE